MGRPSAEIDWEAAERDYRLGAPLTVRQVAKKHGCSTSGLMARAKKEGWTRDLSEAVRVATKTKIREAVVNEWSKTATGAEQSTFSEVDLAANVNATIVLGQQRRVGKLNELLERMVARVEAVTSDTKTLGQIAKALADADPAAADSIKQLASLRNMVVTLKDASVVAAALNQEERKIFRLDDDKPVADDTIEALLFAMKSDPLAAIQDE